MTTELPQAAPGTYDDDLHQIMAQPRSALRTALRSLLASRVATIAAVLVLALVLVAVFAPWIAPFEPGKMHLTERMLWPVWSDQKSNPDFLLGTDGLGRDILSRLIYASRMTLIVAVSSVILSGVIGVLLGLITGYMGGIVDILVMRLADLQLAFPSLLIGLIVMSLLGSGVVELIFVVALTQWAMFARIVRAEVIKVRNMEYVHAAGVLGAGHLRIIFVHVLPNVVASLLIVASFTLALAIFYEAALGFFGLGIPPAIPTWGNMLAEARNVLLRNWWFAFFPGVAITLTILAFNMLGDWFRDYLDVKIE
ncbi:MAG: ABC transporter permease [Pseudorhodobacter sp.]